MSILPPRSAPHTAAAFAGAGLRLDGPVGLLYGLAAWHAAALPRFSAFPLFNEARA